MKETPVVDRRAKLLDEVADYILNNGLADLSLRPLATATDSSPRMLLYFFDALHRSEQTGERSVRRGTLPIAGATPNAQAKVADAEDHFQRAMQVAKRQDARIWELRANLARLLDKQGKPAEARAMLAEIYGCFAEASTSRTSRTPKRCLTS